MVWLLLISGFILLLVGGEVLVKGSVALARRLKMPPLIIGIVLVGFGTSMPELVTCVAAALEGSPDLAVGNVVGSNIANILLVAGIGAILIPIVTPISEFKRDGTVVAASTLMFALAALLIGDIGRIIGAVFVLSLLGYVAFIYFSEKAKLRRVEKQHLVEELKEIETFMGRPMTMPLSSILAIGGITLTILGAKLLVTGAIDLAQKAGVSETVIGLTIVAIGTSLPELVTAVVAGLRNHGDVSLGNILGSNIYNILGILGITALVDPLTIPPEILRFDLWVMILATVMLAVFALRKRNITRIEGGFLLATYVVYLYMLYIGQSGAPAGAM
ncbi:MAG: calcium/sodium antiporter [Alphaproteobacteria bacterium]|nr:MAG: calcium/sodium antiporter [Alphaproteobacteria bacterium]